MAYEIVGGRTSVPLEFAPHGSLFVLFRKSPAAAKTGTANFEKLHPLAELAGPWTVAFDPQWGGPDSAQFDELSPIDLLLEKPVFNTVEEEFVGVLDYHEVETPGWCDHTATFKPRRSVEFETWMGQNRKQMTQVDFARFLEENMPDIVHFEGGDSLAVSVRVHNAGERHFYISGDVAVTDSTGARMTSGPLPTGVVLPGAGILASAFGLLFGLVYLRTGTLWLPAALHFPGTSSRTTCSTSPPIPPTPTSWVR